jgi:transcriptional regulator with XRE-family HTH domain
VALPDMAELRALLARQRITRQRFAELAGLDPATVSKALNEINIPGELARIKMQRALKQIGVTVGGGGDE